MGRTIAAVIVGYVAMFVIVFVGLTVAYLAMGADGAFQPGSYDISLAWIVVMLIVGVVAALVAGMVAAAIAGKPSGVKALAVVVLILGVLSAIPSFVATPPGERTADVSSMDAMMKAVTPIWAAIVNPIIGVVGVLIGGSFVRQQRD